MPHALNADYQVFAVSMEIVFCFIQDYCYNIVNKATICTIKCLNNAIHNFPELKLPVLSNQQSKSLKIFSLQSHTTFWEAKAKSCLVFLLDAWNDFGYTDNQNCYRLIFFKSTDEFIDLFQWKEKAKMFLEHLFLCGSFKKYIAQCMLGVI